MIEQKSNLFVLKAESFLIPSILLFLLLISINLYSGKSGTGNRCNPVTTERSISQNQAVFCSNNHIISCPENLIRSRNDFRLLTIRKAPDIESIKSDIRISQFRKIQRELKIYPVPFFRYHIPASESDEFPLLS